MTLDSIQILAISIIFLIIVKLLYMFLKRKSLNIIFKPYFNAINKNSWLFFITYLSLSLLGLYILRCSEISYTLILANTLFFGFLVNSAFIAMPSMYDGLDFSKINWTMMGIYIFVWLFIMFKSIKEIFNF